MAKLLRGFLLLALVCICTWAVVIVYWQEIHLAPTLNDIAIYLLVVPLAIYLLLLLVRWLWRRRVAGKAAMAAAGAIPVASAAVPAAALPSLKVLAAEVVTPMGEDFASIVEALLAEPLPPLDRELIDQNGFPLAARRYADMDLELLPLAWRSEADAVLPMAQQRALVLLARLITHLDVPLAQLAAAQAGQIQPKQANRAAVLNPAWLGEAAPLAPQKQVPQRIPRQLQVQLLLEPHFDEHMSGSLKRWLMELLAMCGMTEAQVQIEVRAMPSKGLSRHLNAMVEELALVPEPVAVLLLSAGSTICQQLLDDGLLQEGGLASSGMYFPGEAAAALLVANAAFELPDCPALARLGPTRLSACESIARSRPHAAQALPNLLQDFATGQALPADLSWLCSGLGLGSEAIETAPMLAAVPNPVQVDEVLHLRGAVGDAGPAARLTAYALACQAVAAHGKPALLALNDGLFERGLCLLDIVPEPVDVAAADAAQAPSTSAD